VAARGEHSDEAAARMFGLVGWYCSTGPGHVNVGRLGLLASGPVIDSFFPNFQNQHKLCNSIW
jgi:hypothetical protein